MTSWDPPFPVDLEERAPKDEDYWDRYRAAPKAFITLADGQRLWGSRLRQGVVASDPGTDDQSIAHVSIRLAAGFSARHVASRGAAAAAQGTTDFGEYFLYFSFFLVVSALLLAYLFFAVGLEQRTTEIGVLAALGFSPGAIRRAFVREGAVLAGIGALIGAVAAVGYGAVIMYGLRTWWVGAVGTTRALAARRAAVAGHRRRPARSWPGSSRIWLGRPRHEPALGAIAAEGRHRSDRPPVRARPRNSSPDY